MIAPGPEPSRDPDGTGGPHAFVADLDAPELSDADRHHLARVQRIRAGAPMTIGDGQGAWRPARFGPTVEVTGPVIRVPRPAPRIGVGFALVKGSRIDEVTRHLTELGVDDIMPFTSERCVVRWDDATAHKRRARLERISVEAAMQCRRAWLPTVHPVRPFSAVVQHPGAVVAQMDAPPLEAGATTVLVGPEGGFTAGELAQAPAVASVADHVLRAETAALAAGTLLGVRRRVVA